MLLKDTFLHFFSAFDRLYFWHLNCIYIKKVYIFFRLYNEYYKT